MTARDGAERNNPTAKTTAQTPTATTTSATTVRHAGERRNARKREAGAGLPMFCKATARVSSSPGQVPGAAAPRTPAFAIARATKPDAITASVNCLTKAAVSGRSLGYPIASALLP
jgi:hypothetical protein